MLAEVGSDIVTEIGLLLHDSSRNTLFSLIRVNKALHNLILPFIYRRCTFDFSDPRVPRNIAIQTPIIETQEKLKSFLRTDSLSGVSVFQSVRHLIVKASSSHTMEDTDRSKWTLLAEFISRLSHLHEITFDCPEPVPLVLLEVLHQHHPSSRLHVRNWTRRSQDVRVGDPHEEALARSPCLRSIEASFLTGGSSKMDLNKPAFERVIMLAPNIESVSFATRSAGGCVVYGFSPEALEAERREAEKFNVHLPEPKGSVKKLQWDDLHEHTIHWLEKIVDLSKLEELEVGSVRYDALLYARNHGVFRSLKHLSLTLTNAVTRPSVPVSEIRSAVVDFICSLPPLETLSIVTDEVRGLGLDVVVPQLLLHHGSSLRSFSFHEVEDITVPCRRVLSPSQLDEMCVRAPGLSSLEFDINRIADEKHANAVYASVSAFPGLVRVAIHYDLGLYLHTARLPEDLHDEVVQAYTDVNERFARAVWKGVGGEREGSRLEELVLYVGEQNRDVGFGYPAHWVLHEANIKHVVRVRRDERDGRRSKVHVTDTGNARRRWLEEIEEIEDSEL